MVSKNRFSGRTGPAGDLLFDPVTYTLSEDYGFVAEISSPSIVPQLTPKEEQEHKDWLRRMQPGGATKEEVEQALKNLPEAALGLKPLL